MNVYSVTKYCYRKSKVMPHAVGCGKKVSLHNANWEDREVIVSKDGTAVEVPKCPYCGKQGFFIPKKDKYGNFLGYYNISQKWISLLREVEKEVRKKAKKKEREEKKNIALLFKEETTFGLIDGFVLEIINKCRTIMIPVQHLTSIEVKPLDEMLYRVTLTAFMTTYEIEIVAEEVERLKRLVIAGLKN